MPLTALNGRAWLRLYSHTIDDAIHQDVLTLTGARVITCATGIAKVSAMSEEKKRSALALRVDALVERYGSLRAAARVVGVNYAYLHRLRTGEKTEPTAAVLRKLGLRRVVTYELLRP